MHSKEILLFSTYESSWQWPGDVYMHLSMLSSFSLQTDVNGYDHITLLKFPTPNIVWTRALHLLQVLAKHMVQAAFLAYILDDTELKMR